ncbi:MAG: 5-(carboxyamino)imidazole ribonucleotide synthase [Candidatus Korobacteraceae bacterium]
MKPILPGSTVGVLGSGQLGRMFAIAARQMGYRVHTLSAESDTPTGQVSDLEVTASYHDLDAIRRFAANVSVVTFEFENVPASTIEAIAGMVPVRPGGHVLHIAQHRIREKTFVEGAGLPVAPFRVVRSLQELERGLAEIGCPAVLKTASFGYDGKGQVAIKSAEQAADAWEAIGRNDAVLEAFIDFDCEVSVVAARGLDGSFAHYGLLENRHRNHILDVTIAPARVSPCLAEEAVEMARTLLEKLEVVGVLCVEFFVTRQGKLLINELAPRPHNSGHFTVDACVTSQFEQQLRAVCGLPLGSTRQLCPAAMANLLGDVWSAGEPDWVSVCSHPNVKLHLYGKLEPRPGRKMGHLTALATDPDAALQAVLESRKALAGSALK